jgi:hypothetical protein
VAHRDRAAVGVDLVLIEPELACGDQADGREGLVDLDQVEIAGGQALLGSAPP